MCGRSLSASDQQLTRCPGGSGSTYFLAHNQAPLTRTSVFQIIRAIRHTQTPATTPEPLSAFRETPSRPPYRRGQVRKPQEFPRPRPSRLSRTPIKLVIRTELTTRKPDPTSASTSRVTSSGGYISQGIHPVDCMFRSSNLTNVASPAMDAQCIRVFTLELLSSAELSACERKTQARGSYL
jgi:hypothetical protein